MIQTVTPYDIKVVFVTKITSVRRKINKICCHQSCTFLLKYARNHLSVGDSPQTHSAPPDSLAVFWGLLLKRGERMGEECRGGERESLS